MNPEESITPSGSTVSPFSATDRMLNSTAGLVGFIAIDHFADRSMIGALEESANLHFDNDKLVEKVAGSPGRHGMTGPRARREAIINRYNQHLRGGSGRYGANTGLKAWRRALTAQRNANPSWLVKGARFLVDTPEKKAHTLAVRQIAGEIVRGESSLPVSRKLMGELKFGSRMHGLGIAAISVGLASMGFELGAAAMSGLSEKGRKDRSLTRNALQSQGFLDSKMAYTSRQRALQAIQLSQGGYKRALGNEASYLHQVQ